MSLDRATRRRKEKTLRKIKIVPTDFKLTAATGLGTVLEIFDQSPLACEFKKCLPERISHRSAGSYLMALMVIAGHIHGVSALSDLAQIKEDPYLEKLFDMYTMCPVWTQGKLDALIKLTQQLFDNPKP